jgi:hypothetical protein
VKYIHFIFGRFHFDYADERIGQNITLLIEDPLVGDYWIGIYGAARCGYTLRIIETGKK